MGRLFLEKIVQASFKVPKPEAFDLRRWFREELEKLFCKVELPDLTNLREAEERFSRVIDIQAGFYLKTPRDVTRALNALRLYLPSKQSIDKADLVWLQLLRVFDPDIYEMVEHYMVEAAVVGPYAQITTGEDERLFEKLEKHIEHQSRAVADVMTDLQGLLPGICRFGSPQHYRLYTAFSEPAGSLSDAQVREFLSMLEVSLPEATDKFAKLLTAKRPQGGVLAEVMLDRILSWGVDNLSRNATQNILMILSNEMNAAATIVDVEQITRVGVWGNAQRVFRMLFQRLPADARQEVLERTFGAGHAIGWLTDIMRDEIFSHGHYASRRTPESSWLLNENEFAWLLRTMTNRFKMMQPSDLIQAPKFVSLLYAWRQADGGYDVRSWLAEQTKSDEGLLNVLERMRSEAYSSKRGAYFPLKEEELSDFFNYTEVRARVDALAERTDVLPEIKSRAEALAIAFRNDKSL
jgi:predicted KAP-like P-loop ATPase